MKTFKFTNLLALSFCLSAIGLISVASAQSVRHDKMDALAARRDLEKLERERRDAMREHNWGKVAQDDRLIAADRFWIRKDVRRVERSRD